MDNNRNPDTQMDSRFQSYNVDAMKRRADLVTVGDIDMPKPSEPVTLTFTNYVPLAVQSEFETCVRELHTLFEGLTGFYSADVVRHTRDQQMEYTVLLRFADEASSENWQNDPTIAQKLKELRVFTGGPAHSSKCVGLGMWVDHIAGVEAKSPPFWKQLIFSVLGVYPTLLVILAVTDPLIGGLPRLLAILISVTLLSALMIYPIVPMLSKVLQPWMSR